MKQQIEIPMTTLPFYRYEEEGIIYYEFDATECSPPEPMVNAMNALKHLQEGEVLIGKFFHEPQPLYNHVEEYFHIQAKALDDGNYEVRFTHR